MLETLKETLNAYMEQQPEITKGMAGAMENIIHLKNWKNIENKPVTGCELGVFLYSASVAEKQSGTEY